MAAILNSLALVVITLLQLCRAEILYQPQGPWFSANGHSDGFSPKPISELFSTEGPPGFSTTKPIIVPEFSSIPPEPITGFSSTEAPFSSSTSLPPFSSSSPLPPISFSTSVPVSSFSFSTVSDYSKTPTVTQWPPTTVLQTQTKPIQTLQASLATVPQGPVSKPPNFVIAYENTPRPIQTVPSTERSTEFTKAPLILTSPIPTTTIAPVTLVTDETPFITNGLSDGTSRPTVTFRSTPPTFLTPSTRAIIPGRDQNVNPATKSLTSVTPPSLRIVPGPPPMPIKSGLRIQVVAPKGSITNIKINPTTTTKAPTTKRTKRPKKNTYEGCVDACRGHKDPICAVPLASIVIDPKTLKGFPSICHMACHNSFKKDAYEKIIDGRCGRLRTRIISVDSNAKIQRHELKKTEYSVINTGPQTVVEFAHGIPKD